MTHFATLVLVGERLDYSEAEDAAGALLAPYAEDDEWFREGSRWDWWVIGGRWTGALDPEYDPFTDLRNTEVCDLCSGTGIRPDGLERFGEEWVRQVNGCNGCKGKGTRIAFALAPHPKDVLPVRDLPDDFVPAALVTPDGKWHERGRYGFWGMMIDDENDQEPKEKDVWEATYRALLEQYPEATAILVDCHV